VTVTAAGFDLNVNDRFGLVSWVDEGMKVIAPVYIDGERKAILCEVIVAAGEMARVENKTRGFTHWYMIEKLRMEIRSTGE